ncbi:MAG: hypothetical protein ACYTGN_06105 [Planctomycetota bacterium]|jgi:hypothetical protein
MRTALLALLSLAAVALAEPAANEKLAAEDEIDLGNVELLAQAHANQWRFKQVDKAAMFAFSLSRNNLSYKTQGTALDKDTSADNSWYRLQSEYFGGVEFVWSSSDKELTPVGTSAQSYDLFWYGGYPNQVHPNLRFRPRVGFFWNYWNIKDATLGDVEPWSLGFRVDVEAEWEWIKTPDFHMSVFASGRIGFGWGDAQVGNGRHSAQYLGWGYEAGLRITAGNFYAAVSWLDRADQYDSGSAAYSDADFRTEGVIFGIGGRF